MFDRTDFYSLLLIFGTCAFIFTLIIILLPGASALQKAGPGPVITLSDVPPIEGLELTVMARGTGEVTLQVFVDGDLVDTDIGQRGAKVTIDVPLGAQTVQAIATDGQGQQTVVTTTVSS